MITELSLKNFKSWRDTGCMKFAALTALFGANSSGKTSILQFLLMLKQTAESPDRSQILNLGDDRSLVELGTFQDLIWNKKAESSPLEWMLEWEAPAPLNIENPEAHGQTLFKARRLRHEARLRWAAGGKRLGRVAVERMSYGFDGHFFSMEREGPEGKEEFGLHARGGTGPDFRFKRNPGRAWPLPPPAKCYGFPDQVRAYFQNAAFLSDFELQFEEMTRGIFYLGPLRDYPRRQYAWSGTRPGDMGRRGERVVDALLASREAGTSIKQGRGVKRMTVEERVALRLRDLGLIDKFEVRPVADGGKLFQVWVKKARNASEVLLTDVGFGVSQILPVITLCYYAPEGSTLILEQPEIHLHPSVQAGLADVFIDAALGRNIQIVLESHSEHLLQRLQRRIAEQAFPHEKAALYFCSTGRDGASRATPLETDMTGHIKNWPKDFFGDEFGEIAAAERARQKRRLEPGK